MMTQIVDKPLTECMLAQVAAERASEAIWMRQMADDAGRVREQQVPPLCVCANLRWQWLQA